MPRVDCDLWTNVEPRTNPGDRSTSQLLQVSVSAIIQCPDSFFARSSSVASWVCLFLGVVLKDTKR